jgi:hypothetical protein
MVMSNKFGSFSTATCARTRARHAYPMTCPCARGPDVSVDCPRSLFDDRVDVAPVHVYVHVRAVHALESSCLVDVKRHSGHSDANISLN